ncbi:hypothetical protein DEJ49_28205 [Streptomyces venezuelae]|uniref:Uncharacterized protein n=1 Tax=Streptomyces venezuelae TaxID=54571 RepID=A0A5P2CQS5_STRVZ|nr:hypothetical protein DEJ49_28205 [Streptomyces venezuelae]
MGLGVCRGAGAPGFARGTTTGATPPLPGACVCVCVVACGAGVVDFCRGTGVGAVAACAGAGDVLAVCGVRPRAGMRGYCSAAGR